MNVLIESSRSGEPQLWRQQVEQCARVLDLAGGLGLDIGGAIAEKLQYNGTRMDHQIKNRRAVGGKKF